MGKAQHSEHDEQIKRRRPGTSRAWMNTGWAERDVAGAAEDRAVDAVAEALFEHNYVRVLGLLRREFRQWPEDLCHDAIIDALEEIRCGGAYRRYSRIAEGDLVTRSRLRAIDRVRREGVRRAIAPTMQLHEEAIAGADELSRLLNQVTLTGRLAELVLPLGAQETRFLFLTVLLGFSRDEAAARLTIATPRARRLVTITNQRVVEFYVAVTDNSIHAQFQRRLDMLLKFSRIAVVLGDPAIRAHLGWCERCGELLQAGTPSDRPNMPPSQ